jgi:hypothetical protein
LRFRFTTGVMITRPIVFNCSAERPT